MKVRVDDALCQGHTLCSFTAPDVFRLGDEDGHAHAIVEDVPSGLEEQARRAAAGCPERAIVIED
jgi:ferredoxin